MSKHYNVGINNPMYGLKRPHISEIMKKRKRENNTSWKCNDVSYRALHKWLDRNFRKPELCENCHGELRLCWANISGMYLRDRADYRALCYKCHAKDQNDKKDQWKRYIKDEKGMWKRFNKDSKDNAI